MMTAKNEPHGPAADEPLNQDVEFEAGALASRHGISVDLARSILGKCGTDASRVEAEVEKWKSQHDGRD